MKLSDKELLKRVLYDDRHEDADDSVVDADEQLDEAIAEIKETTVEPVPAKKAAAQRRKELIEQEKAKKKKRRKFLLVAVPLAFVLTLAAGAIAYDYLSSWGTIHHNVVVSNIAVGGKTLEEAREYLDLRLSEYAEDPVEVIHLPLLVEAGEAEDSTEDPAEDSDEYEEDALNWEIYAAELGLSFDTTAAAQEAFDFGRSENLLEALRDRAMSYLEDHQVAVTASADDEKAAERFEEIRSETDISPVDSRVTLEDDTFEMVSGSDGIKLDETELIVRIANAVLTGSYQADAPVEPAPRDIDDANATRAAATANSAKALPIEISYNDRSWTYESEDLARLITFKRNDRLEDEDVTLFSSEPTPTTDFVLEAILHSDEVQERVIDRLGADVNRAPVNARFSVRGGEVIIHPSEIGSGIDTQQLKEGMAEALMVTDAGERSVEVSMNDHEPRRSKADAEAMNIRERIATYTTTFSASNRPRVNNIRLISEILDGTIIAPGEEFSFNGTTGQRTAARGFQEAGAIIRGEMSTSIGGGICQVSTTLFNTTMDSGVQITQRINHSTFLSAYPAGRDATVAWNGPDFRFRNTLDNYILISTATTDSSVTISFFGLDPGYTIDVRTGEFRRSNFGTEEVRDNTLPRGTRVVERAGQRGGTINVYYTVRDGNRVVREQTFTSSYRSIDEIVRVGTQRPASSDDDSGSGDD